MKISIPKLILAEASTIITYQERHPIHVYLSSGLDVWFVADDVYKALHIMQHQEAKNRLRPEEQAYLFWPDGRPFLFTLVVDMFGLYALTDFVPEKTQKPFVDWFCKILPVINHAIIDYREAEAKRGAASAKTNGRRGS